MHSSGMQAPIAKYQFASSRAILVNRVRMHFFHIQRPYSTVDRCRPRILFACKALQRWSRHTEPAPATPFTHMPARAYAHTFQKALGTRGLQACLNKAGGEGGGARGTHAGRDLRPSNTGITQPCETLSVGIAV